MQTAILEQQGGKTFVRLLRPRRFGSTFPALRRSYLFVLPSILITSALLCWTFGTDLALITGAVVLGSVACYLLFDLLGRRAPLRVSTVLAFTLGLAYGVGTANTWFTLPRGDENIGDFLHLSTPDLTYAMASILVSLALLIGLGELYERPIFGEEFNLEFNNRALVFLTLGALILAASFARGSTSFQGAVAGEGGDIGHLGIIASLAQWLAGPLLALAACVAVNIKQRLTRYYARILGVLIFIMIFPMGRRTMIYSVILAFIGLRMGRYRVRYSPLKKIILLGLLSSFIYFATIGFYFLRVAGYGLLRPTLGQRLSAAYRLFEEKDYADVKRQFSENVQRRTFILGFLAQVESYARTMPTAHGTDFAEQFQLALPSLLYSGKDLFFTEEQLTNELFGSNYLDEANSLYTAGAVDFGLWGVLLYPILAVVFFRGVFELVSEAMPVFAACFIVLGAFADILQPENTLTAYFVIVRNGIFFGGGVWFIMSLPEFRIKNVGL